MFTIDNPDTMPGRLEDLRIYIDPLEMMLVCPVTEKPYNYMEGLAGRDYSPSDVLIYSEPTENGSRFATFGDGYSMYLNAERFAEMYEATRRRLQE